MKTHNLPFKKAPKASRPVSVKTLKGGCRYFSVLEGTRRLCILGTFTVKGRPFRSKKPYRFWKVDIIKSGGVFAEEFLMDNGILPHKHRGSLSRTFRWTEQVWGFYSDLVARQDMQAYKEAIAGTL